MRLIGEVPCHAQHIGIFPGTFNPPTRAHLALAEAALRHLDHVLLVLPGALPHKSWGSGATPEQRLEMLDRICRQKAGVSAAASTGGLYIEIADDAASAFPASRISVICGRDAAERILAWDYGRPGVAEDFLQRFELIVAGRKGWFQPPDTLSHRVRLVDAGPWDDCSSSLVRDRVPGSELLIPDEIVDLVAAIY
ncbi:MAG TPA: adenylyltransferase/cytidyltransferase family protein [Bryobacteraceae bacterium]|nr:adenylyltransferase/cytidyltransferase family protein [Bryobacteraceae bacterium]